MKYRHQTEFAGSWEGGGGGWSDAFRASAIFACDCRKPEMRE